jgi:YesN/AraC family two-component response regulator
MKYKVLVAEDELIERMVLCKILKKHLGEFCEIYESKNGREALEVFQKEQPQIAILDIEMPGINGLEVARKIRESGKDCTILFLTGFDKFSYAKQAISVRALEYLLKPYNEQELIYAVEEAMQHASRFLKKETQKADNTVKIPQTAEEDNENIRISLIREDIRTYIGKNYQNDISMQSAAQFMGYSEAYFCKLFKQCFRVNFSAYLNEYRIDKAKVMMADPRINIKDIGIACGYSDSNYFARVFKRITGQTPSDYRLAAAEKAIKG